MSDSDFGKSVPVTEPAVGGLVRVGLVQVDQDSVGYLTGQRSPKSEPNAFPRSRDWTVYIRPENVPAVPALVGPAMVSEVKYGTGGATLLARGSVAQVGSAIHVVAQNVALAVEVTNALIATPREFRVAASVQPGKPVRTVMRQQVYPTGAPLEFEVPIPPFAVDVSACGKTGGLAVAATDVEFGYTAGGVYNATVVYPACDPTTPRIEPSGYASIPPQANAARFRLNPAAGLQYIEISWGICA